MEPSTPRALIVGAGPYGLGLANALWHHRVTFVVAGEPFALWHRHTLDAMALRSDDNSSEIYSPNRRYRFHRWLAARAAGNRGARIPVGVFREYLRELEAQLPYPIQRTFVTRLELVGERFHAEFADGRRHEAPAAVVATGAGGHAHLPEALRGLPRERVHHSWDVATYQGLTGQRVLVIGRGQSAGEAVETLRGANEVTWALERPPLFVKEPLRLPTPLFRAVLALSPALYQLPLAARRTLARVAFHTTMTPELRAVYEDPRITRHFARAEQLGLRAADDGLFCAANGHTYDHVVAATGFRYSLDGLPFLGPALRARLQQTLVAGEAVPRLDASFMTPVPGLFFAGGISESTYGPAQRFILGSREAARRICHALG